MNATNGGTVVRVTALALRIGPEALIGQQVPTSVQKILNARNSVKYTSQPKTFVRKFGIIVGKWYLKKSHALEFGLMKTTTLMILWPYRKLCKCSLVAQISATYLFY